MATYALQLPVRRTLPAHSKHKIPTKTFVAGYLTDVVPASVNGDAQLACAPSRESYSSRDQVEAAIRDSARLLQLKANWDDEGARPVDHRSYSRAIDFLRRGDSIRILGGASLPVPR